ncbi:hypothetical protein C8255_15665, partial [filamentous cyanobacterium CCP3]
MSAPGAGAGEGGISAVEMGSAEGETPGGIAGSAAVGDGAAAVVELGAAAVVGSADPRSGSAG